MKKFTKLLKDKKWKWTAGGVMCLVVAALIFALGGGFGSSAQTANVTLGSANITFDVVDNETNTYWIKTKEQLQAIGNGSATETGGKTFYLYSDLSLRNITAPAMEIGTGISPQKSGLYPIRTNACSSFSIFLESFTE